MVAQVRSAERVAANDNKEDRDEAQCGHPLRSHGRMQFRPYLLQFGKR